MRLLFAALAVAGIAVPAVPATAAAIDRPAAFAAATDRQSVRVHRGGGTVREPFTRDFRRDRDDRRDRDRRRERGADVGFAYRDYQGDSLWRVDSFNDWWHERPHRAYPAWMARNEACERRWWSGGDWRC